jgi:hypothetical protein
MVLVLVRESHFAWLSIGEGGAKQSPLFSEMSCSHIFSEKGMATAQHSPQVLTELNQN